MYIKFVIEIMMRRARAREAERAKNPNPFVKVLVRLLIFGVACTILPWVTCALWECVYVQMNEVNLMNDRVCQIQANQKSFRKPNNISRKPWREQIIWRERKKNVIAFKPTASIQPNAPIYMRLAFVLVRMINGFVRKSDQFSIFVMLPHICYGKKRPRFPARLIIRIDFHFTSKKYGLLLRAT